MKNFSVQFCNRTPTTRVTTLANTLTVLFGVSQHIVWQSFGASEKKFSGVKKIVFLETSFLEVTSLKRSNRSERIPTF